MAVTPHFFIIVDQPLLYATVLVDLERRQFGQGRFGLCADVFIDTQNFAPLDKVGECFTGRGNGHRRANRTMPHGTVFAEELVLRRPVGVRDEPAGFRVLHQVVQIEERGALDERIALPFQPLLVLVECIMVPVMLGKPANAAGPPAFVPRHAEGRDAVNIDAARAVAVFPYRACGGHPLLEGVKEGR